MKIARSLCTALLTATAFMLMPLPATTVETVSTGPFITSVDLINHGFDEAVVFQTMVPEKPGMGMMPSGSTVTITYTVRDEDGTLVGEVSQSVPVNAIATMRFEAGETMSEGYVSYNANGTPIGQLTTSGERIPASIKMRAKITDGIGPATEALMTVPASRVPVTNQTIINKNTGETRATTGTVKWFNPTKGFGFIQPDDG